jgi:hypothetical protein
MDKGGIRDKCLLSKGQCMAKGYMFVKKQEVRGHCVDA